MEPTLPRKVAIHLSARIACKNSPGGFAEAVRFFHGLRRHCAGNGACRSIGLSDSIVRLFVGSLGIAARSTETHCDGSKPYNDRHSANFETQSDRNRPTNALGKASHRELLPRDLAVASLPDQPWAAIGPE